MNIVSSNIEPAVLCAISTRQLGQNHRLHWCNISCQYEW